MQSASMHKVATHRVKVQQCKRATIHDVLLFRDRNGMQRPYRATCRQNACLRPRCAQAKIHIGDDVVLLRAGPSVTKPPSAQRGCITLASAGTVSQCLFENEQTLTGMLGQLHQHHTFLACDRLAAQAASVSTTSTQPLSAWRCGRESANTMLPCTRSTATATCIATPNYEPAVHVCVTQKARACTSSCPTHGPAVLHQPTGPQVSSRGAQSGWYAHGPVAAGA
jgi:hypothetical protein